MSEAQSRPATRGRSTTRGRGGYRGAPRSKNSQTDSLDTGDHTADDGELFELKQRYGSQLATLKEMFPEWTNMDLLLGLQDCDGDLTTTVEKISTGHVSQFSEISKKTKDRSRSKVAKDAPVAGADTVSTSTRAPRGRGAHDSTRGGRGRGDRGGRGGARGGRGGAVSVAPNGAASIATADAAAWANDTQETVEKVADKTAAKVEAVQETSKAPTETAAPAKKTWASMFSLPKPPPAAPKPAAPAAAAPPAANVPETLGQKVAEDVAAHDPIPPVADEVSVADSNVPAAVETPEITEEPPIELTPSKDQLTEENVEHLPDASQPVATETVASNIDPGSVVGSATPSHQGQQAPVGRPPMGGFATTAFKATATPGRSASYNRRLFEQQEAVVMPGSHSVDRAAVQFGSLGLNGDADGDAQDVDEDREDAQTREPPPQQSPTMQPRTALPPAPRQPSAPAEQQPVPESIPTTTKPAPGLPPAPQHAAQQSPGALNPPPGVQQNQQYSQFGRYGQTNEPAAPAQKSYDPFGHQTPQSVGQYDNYPGSSQAPGQQPQAAQSSLGGFSSAPGEMSSYYTADQQRNNSYNSYYNQYGQHGGQQAGLQDAGANQQRTGSAFGSAAGDSAFPTSQAQQIPSRYSEAPGSGNNTPGPTLGGQQHSQSHGPGHHQQHGGHPSHGSGYGYNHPYYQAPYYQNYISQMNQYGGYGGQGYGPYGGKNQLHGQSPYGYGMSPQSSFDQHSSSPATSNAFTQQSSLHNREGGFGDYGRSGSTQPTSTQSHSSGNTGFGGASDPFSRQQSGYQGQSQGYGQQPGGQQPGADESLKPYGEGKSNAGPSPSALGAQPGRPGSATNNSSGGNNNSLPPPQSHQQGFGGGYPSHLGNQGQQGSQYGLGGLGGHQGQQQGHQNQGYGYQGFGGYGSGYNNRGGWSSNFGH